jgi:hypothetical protein
VGEYIREEDVGEDGDVTEEVDIAAEGIKVDGLV